MIRIRHIRSATGQTSDQNSISGIIYCTKRCATDETVCINNSIGGSVRSSLRILQILFPVYEMLKSRLDLVIVMNCSL